MPSIDQAFHTKDLIEKTDSQYIEDDEFWKSFLATMQTDKDGAYVRELKLIPN